MGVLPPNYKGGTNLNPQVVTYEDLSIRVQRQLGAPLINLELTDEQMYDCITDAIEYFTKWAGYTEEYLIFDSKLYVPGIGIKVDDLINKTHKTTPRLQTTTASSVVTTITTTVASSLSADWDGTTASALLTCTTVENLDYDDDLASFRKVIDCFEFSKGEDTGINTLFTLEQSMAQQIYSSYMIGNFGFDLITWEVLKGFIDTRNKVLAMTPHFRFDAREQLLKIIPEPTENHTYMGIVGCYIERPIKHLISERYVQKLALAKMKIAIARVREKYTGTNLCGGGSVNSQSLLSEGIAEVEKYEQEIRESYIDNTPPTFFIG